jgi:hypothetical protein
MESMTASDGALSLPLFVNSIIPQLFLKSSSTIETPGWPSPGNNEKAILGLRGFGAGCIGFVVFANRPVKLIGLCKAVPRPFRNI